MEEEGSLMISRYRSFSRPNDPPRRSHRHHRSSEQTRRAISTIDASFKETEHMVRDLQNNFQSMFRDLMAYFEAYRDAQSRPPPVEAAAVSLDEENIAEEDKTVAVQIILEEKNEETGAVQEFSDQSPSPTAFPRAVPTPTTVPRAIQPATAPAAVPPATPVNPPASPSVITPRGAAKPQLRPSPTPLLPPTFPRTLLLPPPPPSLAAATHLSLPSPETPLRWTPVALTTSHSLFPRRPPTSHPPSFPQNPRPPSPNPRLPAKLHWPHSPPAAPARDRRPSSRLQEVATPCAYIATGAPCPNQGGEMGGIRIPGKMGLESKGGKLQK